MLYPLSYGGSVGLQYPTTGASLWNRARGDVPTFGAAGSMRGDDIDCSESSAVPVRGT